MTTFHILSFFIGFLIGMKLYIYFKR